MNKKPQQEGIKSIDEIGKKYFQCNCGEIYLSRKLASPDCPYHSLDWESAMEEYHNQFSSPLAELKQKFAQHLGVEFLDRSDEYAIEWALKNLSGETKLGANTIENTSQK